MSEDDKCCECVYVSVDVSDQLTHVVKIHGTRRSGKEQDMEQMGVSDEPVVKKNPAAQATSLFAKNVESQRPPATLPLGEDDE